MIQGFSEATVEAPEHARLARLEHSGNDPQTNVRTIAQRLLGVATLQADEVIWRSPGCCGQGGGPASRQSRLAASIRGELTMRSATSNDRR